MEIPFVYGRIAAGENFTNRENEAKRLISNFLSSVNTTLVSPRRWGKSSLVLKAAEMAKRKDKKTVFCFIDLFNIRTEEEFYTLLAKEILKKTTSKWDEILSLSKKFLGKVIPRLSVSPNPGSEFSISFDWQEVKNQPEEILNFPEKIAKEKNIRIVVCIDEFQNISEFDDPLSFQKKLRANWQKHQKTSYCLYGSKQHMMLEVFTSPSMPFYKFGDLMFLSKISENDWVPFITKRFAATGKKINEENGKLIAQLVENHPYYLQQLAQLCWLRTTKNCNRPIVEDAFEHLQLQLSLLFQTMTDDLTGSQVQFLKALLDGKGQLTSMETIKEYRMGTSANVLRAKEALIKKEILDISEKKIEFLDPVYKQWLKNSYFKAA